jgi:hypothetical protein
MINQIKIDIPYQKRWGIFSITVKKKIWFSFDQLSLFLFYRDEKINDMNDLSEWRKNHGEFDLFVYGAYYAAKSYYMDKSEVFGIDFKKFAFGIAQLDKSKLEEIVKVWKTSQSYGAADLPGKKKAKVKA